MYSPLIEFYVDKNEEKTELLYQSNIKSEYIVNAPIYLERTKKNVIGNLNINKIIYNLDFKGEVSSSTIAIYYYNAVWDLPNYNSSISSFIITPGNQVLNSNDGNGTTEVIGTYYGAANSSTASGDFRNYGGSVEKTIDITNIRKYTLQYFLVNPYNSLPENQ